MSVIFLLYTDAVKADTFADDWPNYVPYLDKANLINCTGRAFSAGLADVDEKFPDYMGTITNIETHSPPMEEVYLIFQFEGLPASEIQNIIGEVDKYPQLKVFKEAMRVHSLPDLFGGIDRVYHNAEHNLLVAVTVAGASFYRDQIAACMRKTLKAV